MSTYACHGWKLELIVTHVGVWSHLPCNGFFALRILWGIRTDGLCHCRYGNGCIWPRRTWPVSSPHLPRYNMVEWYRLPNVSCFMSVLSLRGSCSSMFADVQKNILLFQVTLSVNDGLKMWWLMIIFPIKIAISKCQNCWLVSHYILKSPINKCQKSP